MAEQIFALVVDVDLFGGVHAHHILHKIQIAKGYPRLQTVGGDAPVRPQDVVHMQFPDPLLALPLERLRGGCKVRILVPKQLVADLPRQQDPDIALGMDGPADEVHSHAGPDGGNIVGTESIY